MGMTVRGMQKNGVQTCSKHYIGNKQETQRSNTTLPDGTVINAVSSNIDDRTLHELYLWPFADAVRAGTTSMMCSYQRMNQTYTCENTAVLRDLLRDELGFKGYVVSDWFATHSTSKAANNGLDLEMPGQLDVSVGPYYFGDKLEQAIANESTPVARLDEMARRVLAPYYLLGQDSGYPSVDPSTLPLLPIHSIGRQAARQIGFGFPETPSRNVRSDHPDLVREIGAAGTVLLKNIDNALPLKIPKDIGVFGNDAADLSDGLVILPGGIEGSDIDYRGFDIGTLDIGGGSGTARHTDVIPPLEAIKSRARADGSRVQYILNNEIIAEGGFKSIYPTPDVCLVFLKTFASEGFDRFEWQANWNSTRIVEAVAQFCPNTVVVTHSAGINTMPWADNPNVTAILAAHLPGEQTGNSIVDVLWGEYNPSGKLPYTIPRMEKDYDIPIVNRTQEAFPDAWQADFTEGQMIDYRHFDVNDITPLFEFGFGLSYTTFDMAPTLDVKFRERDLLPLPDNSLKIEPGGNPDLWEQLLEIRVRISNTGSLEGYAVPQLYLSLPPESAPEGTPVQVLRGFERAFLRPGEEKDVVFNLTRRELSFWNTSIQQWQVPAGTFSFRAGYSSRDVKVESGIKILG